MDLPYPAGDQGVPGRSREPAEGPGEFQVGGDGEQDEGPAAHPWDGCRGRRTGGDADEVVWGRIATIYFS